MCDLPNISTEFYTDYSLASNQYKIIMQEIYDFEQNLDDEHEVALRLCNFGDSILLNVIEIGYHNPCLIFYYGTVDGNSCQLIQHTSQISFLMTAVPKSNINKAPKRIGFI